MNTFLRYLESFQSEPENSDLLELWTLCNSDEFGSEYSPFRKFPPPLFFCLIQMWSYSSQKIHTHKSLQTMRYNLLQKVELFRGDHANEFLILQLGAPCMHFILCNRNSSKLWRHVEVLDYLDLITGSSKISQTFLKIPVVVLNVVYG